MIEVKNLHKRYGDQKVLDGVSFSISGGSVTAIIGPSGVGKSVLFRQMIGLEKPDSGEIMIDGENIVAMGARDLNRVRRRFGVLFQEGALFDSLTVRENVEFPLREHTKLSDGEIQRIAMAKLAAMELSGDADKFPAQISGGMRKRLGLARALALDPDIVFFDEPTSGLDPVTRAAIYSLILRTHRERVVTYLMVSHDIEGVFGVSDEVLMLWNGKIVAGGTPGEIRKSRDPLVQQFLTGSQSGPIGPD